MDREYINLIKARDKHIQDVISLLKLDPLASDCSINYKELNEYMCELALKHGNVLTGIIIALEKELEK